MTHTLVLVQRLSREVTVNGQSLRARLVHRRAGPRHLGDYSAGLLGSSKPMLKTIRTWLDSLETVQDVVTFQLVLGLDLTRPGAADRAARTLSTLDSLHALGARLSWNRSPRLEPDRIVLLEVGAARPAEDEQLLLDLERLGAKARNACKSWHPSRRGGPPDAPSPVVTAACLGAEGRDIARWPWLQREGSTGRALRGASMLPPPSWLPSLEPANPTVP